MTEVEVKIILSEILNVWESLTPAEVKGLLKILATRGIMPQCACCNKPILNMQDFSWDHLIARARGGVDHIGNMVPMHTWCNVEKGADINEEYFCHIEPKLLDSMLQNTNKSKKFDSKKHSKKSGSCKRRTHVRSNGWDDSYKRFGHNR